MPEPEVNASVIKTRLASFATVPSDKHSALTCPECGKAVTADLQQCQSCGASCSPASTPDYRVATAAPELAASVQPHDSYQRVAPPYAVPAAYDYSGNLEAEAEYAAPAQEPAEEDEEDELESERRNYARAILVGLLVGVLGLAAMSIWHWRGEIRELSSSLNRELSSELAALKGGNSPAQPRQLSSPRDSAARQKGNPRLRARPAAEQSSAVLVSASAPVTLRGESPTLRLASNSGVSADGLKPALTAAALSPMRVSVAPRESLQLLVYSVPPVYPQLARERRLEGSVALKAVIGRDGTISELQEVSGDPQLVPAAMDAVRQWRYRPYFLRGEAHEVETTILVDFSLARE